MSRGLRNELSLLAGLAATGLFIGKQKPLATAFGVLATGLRFLPTESIYSFQNRSVVITGGSRGLGLALAEHFLNEGACVTLLARDEDELNRAKSQLQDQFINANIFVVPCDITQPEALRHAFDQVNDQFGRLDVLVNNAGSITVGPFETMVQSDFDALLKLQVDAVANAVQLAIPYFKQLGEGKIVNISSIGGRLPVPHMATYCTGKFALTGLSETLSAELAPYNIKVTTVFPGLMRTGSPIQAVFKGDHEKEYAWFAASDVLPLISVSADYAAKKILDGVRHGDAQVVYPLVTRLGILGYNLFPETYNFVMRQSARYFPKGQSPIRKTGAASQGWLERQTWYQPLKKTEEEAEAKLNQHEKFDANFNLGVQSI